MAPAPLSLRTSAIRREAQHNMRPKLLLLAALAAAGSAVLAGSAFAQGGAPQSQTGPWISGSHQVGEMLTANTGQWSSASTVAYAYQWQRCARGGIDCANVGGATDQTYVLGSGDAGSTVRVIVTATNADGASAAPSVATATIQPATGVLGATYPGPMINATSVALPNRLFIDRIKLSPGGVFSRLPIVARIHVTDLNGSAVAGALVRVASVPSAWIHTGSEAKSASDGWAWIRVFPTLSLPLTMSRVFAVVVGARIPGASSNAGTSVSKTVAVKIH